MAKLKRYKATKAKADVLFSQVIRSLGYCEARGYNGFTCSPQLQCAHICSRRYNATRTDTRNAFVLCARHHRHYTDHPREFSHFITETWAQNYYPQVYLKANTPTKVDWEDRVAFLEKIKRGEITLGEARELEE